MARRCPLTAATSPALTPFAHKALWHLTASLVVLLERVLRPLDDDNLAQQRVMVNNMQCFRLGV